MLHLQYLLIFELRGSMAGKNYVMHLMFQGAYPIILLNVQRPSSLAMPTTEEPFSVTHANERSSGIQEIKRKSGMCYWKLIVFEVQF